MKLIKRKKIGVISLGCDKNRVDTEKMLAILGAENVTNDIESAEIIVVNSCAFLESARAEAIETVFECNSYRKNGKLEKLILTGCLPQKFIDEIFFIVLTSLFTSTISPQTPSLIPPLIVVYPLTS